MKKLANVRPPVILALILCLGIISGVVLYFFGLSVLFSLFAIIPAAVALAVIWAVRRKILGALIFVLFALIMFIGGALNSYFVLKNFAVTEAEENYEYVIEGKVVKSGATDYGDYIVIDNIKANGLPISGKMRAYLNGNYGETCDVGYYVKFTAEVNKEYPFSYGKLNYNAEENIKYTAYVYEGVKSSCNFDLFTNMRMSVKRVLDCNVNEPTAAICYGMLTGNTDEIDESSLTAFREGGVAHIFAVSGLHIGLIYALLTFIFKKLHLNKYIAAAVTISLLFCYCAFCQFALSALRAAIMCTVASAANLAIARYDGLNSLSVAVIIILSITPLSLFSVGFRLSVCAIGGIHAFSSLITKLFEKIKLPQKLCSALGMSFAAQLCTAPVMLANFGYISGAGLVLNIIVIPIFSVAFEVVFIAVFLSILLPFIAPILPYAVLPTELMSSVFIASDFSKALIYGFGAGYFGLLFFACILSLTDKLNLKLITRIIAVICSVAILASYVLIRYNYPFTGYAVTISAYGTGGEVIIRSPSGNILILTDDVSVSGSESALNRNYCNKIDAIIILGEDALDLYPKLNIDCREIYMYYNYPQIQPYGDLLIKYVEDMQLFGVDFYFYSNEIVEADIGGVKFGICANRNVVIKECDVLIADEQNTVAACGAEVYFNNRCGPLNVFDCGDITFEVKNGNYTLKNAIRPRQ